MEKLLVGLWVSFGLAAIIPAIMLLSALTGYFGGWLFGLFFSDTWLLVHSWAHMPEGLTPGMFGAFLSAFGGAIGTARASAK